MKTGCHGAALVRVVTGLALLAGVLLLIWTPPLQVGFGLLAVLFVFQGLREFYNLARIRGLTPATDAGVVCGTVVTLSAFCGRFGLTASALCASAVVVCAMQVVRGRLSIADMAASVFGVVYVGWFGAHVVLLHRVPGAGPGLVTVLVVVVTLGDTGAYTIGSWIGKRKLAPKVSPNKTWEGAAGGFVFAVIGMVALYSLRAGVGWQALPDWGLGRYLATGAVLTVAGQFGDLAESALKRDAGLKDSGAIFPGHGGVLDRCDSYLFAAPVLYYLAGVCSAV